MGAPEFPCLLSPQTRDGPGWLILAFRGVRKMALWVRKSKFRRHFTLQITPPPSPEKMGLILLYKILF